MISVDNLMESLEHNIWLCKEMVKKGKWGVVPFVYRFAFERVLRGLWFIVNESSPPRVPVEELLIGIGVNPDDYVGEVELFRKASSWARNWKKQREILVSLNLEEAENFLEAFKSIGGIVEKIRERFLQK